MCLVLSGYRHFASVAFFQAISLWHYCLTTCCCLLLGLLIISHLLPTTAITVLYSFYAASFLFMLTRIANSLAHLTSELSTFTAGQPLLLNVPTPNKPLTMQISMILSRRFNASLKFCQDSGMTRVTNFLTLTRGRSRREIERLRNTTGMQAFMNSAVRVTGGH
jgi:hypothetical protein